MVAISFTHPHYLFFLFLIPLFVFIHLATLRMNASSALKFANFEAIARIRGIDFFSKNILILTLSSFIIFFVVMSLSGLTIHTVLEASEHSIVLAIDNSRSMEADDIFPNRMEAAKKAAMDFIDHLPAFTHVGVVSFAGSSFVEQDLTDSKILIKNAVEDVQISNIGGTDLYEVILTGSNILRGEESKAVVLLSDGQINVGNIKEGIAYANDNDVLVYTIGFGTEEGGQTGYGFSKVDEDSLKSIAYNTDGDFFKASDQDELTNAFNSVIQRGERKVALNFSQISLVIAAAIFTLLFYLINSRYRRWP